MYVVSVPLLFRETSMLCVRCECEIPAERLEAMPETRVCVKCSAEIGGEFTLVVTEERTSKPGSMKLNYGSLTVEKRRRQVVPLRYLPREPQ